MMVWEFPLRARVRDQRNQFHSQSASHGGRENPSLLRRRYPIPVLKGYLTPWVLRNDCSQSSYVCDELGPSGSTSPPCVGARGVGVGASEELPDPGGPPVPRPRPRPRGVKGAPLPPEPPLPEEGTPGPRLRSRAIPYRDALPRCKSPSTDSFRCRRALWAGRGLPRSNYSAGVFNRSVSVRLS